MVCTVAGFQKDACLVVAWSGIYISSRLNLSFCSSRTDMIETWSCFHVQVTTTVCSFYEKDIFLSVTAACFVLLFCRLHGKLQRVCLDQKFKAKWIPQSSLFERLLHSLRNVATKKFPLLSNLFDPRACPKRYDFSNKTTIFRIQLAPSILFGGILTPPSTCMHSEYLFWITSI